MITNGYTPTSCEIAEIALYVDAFAKALNVEGRGERYYNAPRPEQLMIKNDAERAAAAISPQTQKWYDAGRLLMSKHRKGPNSAPDWQRILAEKDGVMAHLVMRGVGNALRSWRSYMTDTANGNGHETNGATNGNGHTNGNGQEYADKYLALVEGWSLIPSDAIVGHLLGVTPGKVGHMRRALKDKKWIITPAELPAWADGRETWWQVTARPPTEEEAKAALADKLVGKIKSLSPAELQALIELVG